MYREINPRKGWAMPYTILFDQFIDMTNTLSSPTITGAIWVPAPSQQKPGQTTNLGAPTFTGTITSGTGLSAALTFPVLDGPPTTDSALLISEPSFGDLYRLPFHPPSDNPAHLNGEANAPPVLTQDDLNNQTTGIPAQTSAIPPEVQAAYAVATAGLWVPRSMTVSAVSLTLPAQGAPAPGALTLTLTGTFAVRHWLWMSTNPFTFTETVSLAPSGDPVDASRTLTATGAGHSLSVIGGWVLGILKDSIGDTATAQVEVMFNQGIASRVAQALGALKDPMQLAPLAAISANKVVITHGGLGLTLSITNLFGPALIPAATPTDTTVPDVIGDTVPDAKTAMEAAHLRMTTVDDGRPDGVTIHTVEDTNPEAGTIVPAGTVVVATLKVHAGAGN
jgi:hypothetical protein